MTTFHSDLVQKTNRFGSRFYETPLGEKLPSVTTILSVIGKPALVNWAARVERELVIGAAADLYEDAPVDKKMSRSGYLATINDRLGKARAFQKEQEKALDIGTQAHKRIEWELRRIVGQEPGPCPECRAEATHAVASFLEWWRCAHFEIVALEQPVWHGELGYAGTLDMLVRDPLTGKLGVFDIKTSKAVYPENGLQVAAYGSAVDWMQHGPVEWGSVLWISKVPGAEKLFDVVPIEEPHFKGGLAACFTAFLNALELYKWQQSMNGKEAA